MLVLKEFCFRWVIFRGVNVLWEVVIVPLAIGRCVNVQKVTVLKPCCSNLFHCWRQISVYIVYYARFTIIIIIIIITTMNVIIAVSFFFFYFSFFFSLCFHSFCLLSLLLYNQNPKCHHFNFISITFLFSSSSFNVLQLTPLVGFK